MGGGGGGVYIFGINCPPQNINITLLCVGDNHLQCNLTCRGYRVSMVKYFNVSSSFRFHPSRGFTFKSLSVIGEKKFVTGPWVGQNLKQMCRSCLQVRLSQRLYELYQHLLTSRKFFLSLWGLVACSLVHVFPTQHELLKAFSCLPHLTFSQHVSPWAESVAPPAKGPPSEVKL